MKVESTKVSGKIFMNITFIEKSESQQKTNNKKVEVESTQISGA